MDFLTVNESAEALSLTSLRVLNRIRRGKLRGTKRGGIWLIPRSEINRFKKALATAPKVYYVYLHLTPEGQVFWVGKSRVMKLTSFGKCRPNLEYRQILKKYGVKQVQLKIVKMGLSEQEATALEKETIEFYRSNGHPLINR